MRALKIRIPEDATLKEIIWILNKMELSLMVDDDDGAKWIYEHQSWVKDKDE